MSTGLLGRFRNRWENNIRMDLKVSMKEVELIWFTLEIIGKSL